MKVGRLILNVYTIYLQFLNALIQFAAVFVVLSHLKVAPPHPRHRREQTHLSYHTTLLFSTALLPRASFHLRGTVFESD